MQEAVSELVGASLVMATRCGLDQPQPVLDSAALAALVNVPTGRFCHPVLAVAGHKLALQKCMFLFLCEHQMYISHNISMLQTDMAWLATAQSSCSCPLLHCICTKLGHRKQRLKTIMLTCTAQS